MDAQAIAAVTIPTVGITQIIKWAGLPDRYGAIVVPIVAAIWVAAWVYSSAAYNRAALFDILAGWVVVTAAAAGVFGYTRAASDAVTATSSPPPGAAQNPTAKGL